MVLLKKYCIVLIFLVLAAFVPAAASVADVTIDNGGAGTSYAGTWLLSGGTNAYGASSLWSRNGTTYTYTMSGQPAGMYEVFMWWSGYDSRASSVPVAINFTGGTSSTTVNQRQNSGQWNSLGTFYFDGTGSVTITAAPGDTVSTCADAIQFRLVSSNTPPVAVIDSVAPSPADVGEVVTFTGHGTDPDGSVVAYEWTSSMDGVIGTTDSFSTAALSSGTHTISLRVKDDENMWSPAVTVQLVVGTPSVEITIDNGDIGTSYTGSWPVSGGTNPYGADSLWSRNGTTYTYTMSGQPAGMYEVFMWWSGYDSRASSVPVAINFTGGTSSTTVNQRQNSGQWNSLGTFYFDGTGSVTITAAPGDTVSTCADAVKFTLRSTNLPPQATIDSITPNPAELGKDIAFTGHGTDPDGSVVAYEWTSSIDGAIGTAASFTTSALSAGTHTISFRVKDNQDLWSQAVATSLVVQGTNIAPTAFIDSIAPNPASYGQSVTFTGHGTDQDGTVTVYEWSSSIDGIIGSAASFSTSGLKEGTHTIKFRVMDNENAWSEAVTSSLTVGSAQPSEAVIDNTDPATSRTGIWSTSAASGYYGTNSLWSRDGTTFTWKFTPAVSGYYDVSMWWTTTATRSSAIPVSITYSGGAQTVTIDQLQNASRWNSLGTYQFTAGTTYSISITSQAGPTSTCADAVKLTPASPLAPTADFSASTTWGIPPFSVDFTDRSQGMVRSWLWDFGDGGTSAEQNPSHTYTAPGVYTVSLTVSNDAGSDTMTRNAYIRADTTGEHIYLADGYSGDALFIPRARTLLQGMGAILSNGVWTYSNPGTGKTFFIHEVREADSLKAAIKTEGAHIIFNGHANFGLGATFATGDEIYRQEIPSIRYINDDRFTNFSSDMVSVKVDGMQYGQAYPNWLPIYKDGTSGIMPYSFSQGLPPYNYYLTYKVPGNPTVYKVELEDGKNLERFPDSATLAWFSPTGATPDPVLNPEYFIINNDVDFNRCDFVGIWPIESVPDGGYMGKEGYLGYNYQYRVPGTGSNTATWTLIVTYPGLYATLASWRADASNASNAKYTVNHSGGPTVVEVDQRVSEFTNMLGVYYFNAGVYTVRLNDNANGRVIADAVVLSAVDNPQKIFQAEFNADIMAGAAPLTVQFSDLSGYYNMADPTAEITGWQWNFGDGSASSLQNPSHTYSSPGVYTVTLTTRDSTGASSTATKTGLIAVGQTAPVRAQFTSSSRLGSDRTVVQFIDQSSGNISSWSWDFGDGATSNEQNPSHTYAVPGAYTVSLTVTEPGGSQTESKTDFVHNIIGLIYADNTAHHRPHFYSRIPGSPITFGKVILDAKPVKIPDEDMRYSRMFYGSCNSCPYYAGTFNRGIFFCTTGDSDSYTALDYLEYYLRGYNDEQLLSIVNSRQPIHHMLDFNRMPPSMR